MLTVSLDLPPRGYSYMPAIGFAGKLKEAAGRVLRAGVSLAWAVGFYI